MRMGQRQREGSRSRRSAGVAARAHLPDVVLILGDIGEVREIAEGAHDANGFADRHAVEDDFQLAPRRAIVIAMEPDRGLPDALDQIEHVGAFLIAHGVAENSPEQPDIRTQPGVGFERQGFVGAMARRSVSATAEGLIWEDMADSSRDGPASRSLQFFRRSARSRKRRLRPARAAS